MDNKTEIKRLEDRIRQMNIEIEEYKKQIEELKKEDAVWKPKQDKKYYYIALGDVEWSKFNNDVDEDNYDIGNCFKTMEETEKAVRHLKTRAKLQRIANRLNGGQVIDWNNRHKDKYDIYYSFLDNEIQHEHCRYAKTQGTIYCLDENFKDIAIKEIGKEELTAYLKGE